MKFWRKNWYYIGLVLFIALAFIMGLWGCAHLEHLQVILIFSWMAMLVHQVEEYALPGGFPMIANMAGLGELDHPERYPLNEMQCFICNVFFCYLSYIIPILFPGVIWMGAAQVFAGVWQVPGHGIALNVRLKSFYNPGLASSLFLQLPIAIYYYWYVLTYMPEYTTQLWWGIPASILILVLTFVVPIVIMCNKNSRYPFSEKELYGYDKEHILKLWEERKEKRAAKEAKENG